MARPNKIEIDFSMYALRIATKDLKDIKQLSRKLSDDTNTQISVADIMRYCIIHYQKDAESYYRDIHSSDEINYNDENVNKQIEVTKEGNLNDKDYNMEIEMLETNKTKFRTVAVPNEVYNIIKEISEYQDRTIAKQLGVLIKKSYAQLKKIKNDEESLL